MRAAQTRRPVPHAPGVCVFLLYFNCLTDVENGPALQGCAGPSRTWKHLFKTINNLASGGGVRSGAP
jgi:hypothetical protein